VPVIRELFEHLSLSPPIGDIAEFLPSLQSLTISTWKISIWECIPYFFSSPHRTLLSLEVIKRGAKNIDNDTLRTILRLVDEGFNIRIFGGWEGLDYLQKFKGKSREGDLSQILDAVVDHTLEGELEKADKEAFLHS
jgi:hypothetical protein